MARAGAIAQTRAPPTPLPAARRRCTAAGGGSRALLQALVGPLRLAQRQGEAERAAAAASARLGPHAAAVRGDDAAAEIQAQAAADHAARRLRAVAAAEELRELGAVQADALVAHADHRAALVGAHRYRDGGALGRVLERVREKIHQHLPHALLVPV